jgi:hypothetical protein
MKQKSGFMIAVSVAIGGVLGNGCHEWQSHLQNGAWRPPLESLLDGSRRPRLKIETKTSRMCKQRTGDSQSRNLHFLF